MSEISKIWKKRIEAGTQVYSDCPDRYKAEVNALLREDVANGIITQEEYERLISL